MDPHVRWLRHRILVAVARSVAVVYGAAVLIGLAGSKLLTGAALVVTVPWALVGGQVLVGLWLGWAAVTNPLGVRYLRARAVAPRRLAVAGTTDPRPRLFAAAGPELVPLATVWDTTEAPYPNFDLFQTPRRSITVVRNRLSGAVTLLSRLDDGRVLLTDTMATAPHRRLVVNLAPEGDPRALLARHLETIAVLQQAGVSVVADDAGLFVEAQAIEQVALNTLGPVLGPFYNLVPAPAPARLLVTLAPAELMALALDCSMTPVRPRTSSFSAPLRSTVRSGALATG